MISRVTINKGGFRGSGDHPVSFLNPHWWAFWSLTEPFLQIRENQEMIEAHTNWLSEISNESKISNRKGKAFLELNFEFNLLFKSPRTFS